jgi:peptide/nickel transport system substrate-binding protein
LSKNFLILFIIGLVFSNACRSRISDDFVTVALPEKFSSFDTLTTDKSDAAAERVRNLMFNSLVRKNEKFEYIGELAREIKPSEEGKIITFVLQDNVKFHNGKDFTSADVKYTFDRLLSAHRENKPDKPYKAAAFYETGENKVNTPHIVSIETPDPKTVVFTLSRAALQNQLMSNLVAIPIIPEGTVEQQRNSPVGSGAFKFVSFDASQNIVELAANENYWEGTPKVKKIRVKTIPDANSLQAELQSGSVDIAPLPSNLSPDTLKSLGSNPNLKVEQFNGSNIQYLQFNTQAAPVNNAKLRQAIAYAIDREKIIKELLLGQASIAHSILPVASWAYNAGTQYNYDPAKAKQLLQESGYKGEPIIFKFAAGGMATNQYAQVIQQSLSQNGINVEIETLERNAFLKQLGLGQYQISTSIWVGGNQDPIFLNDLFTTKKIPDGDKVACCNRSRYSNQEVDKLIEEAFNSTDRNKAKELYFRAQEIISTDVPMLPLWYPANMVVANKRISNIKISPSGDWSFIKDITAEIK